MNLKAVDNTLEHLHEVPLPNQRQRHRRLPAAGYAERARNSSGTSWAKSPPAMATICPSARSRTTARSRPRTAQYEKRNLALEIPVWDEKICIQCLKCVAICPHATIRAKVYDAARA